MQDRAQEEWAAAVLARKEATTIEELCQGQPLPFKQYMKYVRSLKFEQKPNYKMLRGLFENIFKELNYQEDGKFDWVVRRTAIIERKQAEEEAERHRKA